MIKRLLTASVGCVMGTIGVAVLSSPGTPITASILAAGMVNGLINVSTGIIANDSSAVWDKIGDKLQPKDKILQNDDLTKAVGIAVAAVIAQTAKDETKINLVYRKEIQRLGKYIANNWLKLCQNDVISLNEEGLNPIQEGELSRLMLGVSDASASLRVFDGNEEKDIAVWQDLLEKIIDESQILSHLQRIEEEREELNRTAYNLAQALSEQFVTALREVLKEDFAKGGKAFAGLTMDMLGEINQGINETQRIILEKIDETGGKLGILTELKQIAEETGKDMVTVVNEEMSQVNKRINVLLSKNTEAFQELGNQIKSGFGNIETLLDEIDVKLDEVLNISYSIKDDTGEILDTVRRLEDKQQEIQQNTVPSLLITGDTPKQISNWQGRKEELEKIKGWILNPNINLVGIEGIGGIGKSSLVGKIFADREDKALNERVIKRYWADVSNGALFSEMARQVLNKFEGEKQRDETKLVEDLVKCLQSGEYLLVIDNLESILLPNGIFKDNENTISYHQFFNAWQECGNPSTVVVTTREKPKLRGMEWIKLEGLKVEEGAKLLIELGIKGDVAEFSELVGGYPLLLRLVADLLKEEYYEAPDLQRLDLLGLGNLREMLTDERVTGIHRRQMVGMVAVLDATTSRLTPQQKAFWCRLSVYQQEFDQVAASFMGEGEVGAELKKLSEVSLLQRILRGDDYVYQFQPAVKEYALLGLGDASDAHQKAIAYYQSISQANPNNRDEVQPYLESFYHYCQLGHYDTAFDTLQEVDIFLRLQGFYEILVESYSQLVEAFKQENNPYNLKYTASLTSLGNAYNLLGEYQSAIDYYKQSLTIAREIGDRRGEANSLGNLGVAYDSLGEYQSAIDYHQQQLTIAREIGDRKGEANSLGNLGVAYDSLGEYQSAIDYHQQSLTIARDIGNRQGEAAFLGGLGNAYQSLEDDQSAIDYHQQSLTITREIGNRQGEAASLGGLGNAYNLLGEYQSAIDYYQQSLTIAKDIKSRHIEADAYYNLGNIYRKLNQNNEAIQYYHDARELYQKMELASQVTSCDNAINGLSSPQRLSIWQPIKQSLQRLVQYIQSLL
ncbi:MAG: tetratricopeptide repeat protein [Microcystaceae cyanobacterium]